MSRQICNILQPNVQPYKTYHIQNVLSYKTSSAKNVLLYKMSNLEMSSATKCPSLQKVLLLCFLNYILNNLVLHVYSPNPPPTTWLLNIHSGSFIYKNLYFILINRVLPPPPNIMNSSHNGSFFTYRI